MHRFLFLICPLQKMYFPNMINNILKLILKLNILNCNKLFFYEILTRNFSLNVKRSKGCRANCQENQPGKSVTGRFLVPCG